MGMKKPLPSCFVIGTQKAGTSSLHSWLSIQSSLSLPRFKETHFFYDDAKFNRGFDWYINNFENLEEGRILVEVDPNYLSSEIAMDRIHDLYSEHELRPKFICILRDRIDRAKSQWIMAIRRGMEERSFSKAFVESFENPNDCSEYNDYFSRGLYGKHIGNYKSKFQESDFLILGFEDLFSQKQARKKFEEILNFIGAKDEMKVPNFSNKMNQSGVPRSKSIAKILRNEKSFIRKFSRVIIPSENMRIAIGMWLRRINHRPRKIDVEYTEIDPRILDAYREDTAKLLQLFPHSRAFFNTDNEK